MTPELAFFNSSFYGFFVIQRESQLDVKVSVMSGERF